MGMLIDGVWTTKRYEPDEAGKFVREQSQFRDRVTAGDSSGHPAVAGRYHLYVAHACPWVHRTLLARGLLGLEQAISISVVDPFMGDDGWAFTDRDGCVPDPIFGARFLRSIYLRADPGYSGRVTVPVLWDRERATIVCNESRELLRMLDVEFAALHTRPITLFPEPLQRRVDRTIDQIYEPINNGVYKAGFATQQAAYEEAVRELFAALDHWDGVLAEQRFLCGDVVTEADLCLFTTLLRFDPVYHGHFKCNLRRIVDYPHLSGYLRDLYQLPGVAELCRLDHIKEHYYRSHPHVNPTRIVPLGPISTLEQAHDRGRFGGELFAPKS
ncbi:putative glutathione S-transferase [Nannocystis exedens]|uniref:Putative glutathione S-transferase n=2 Tax=Nannocystis exedens TaxID=54 RepID=A0A1I2H2A4_9BACT|nr:glutathione-dependent reductase [Nannocystis exedens]SFF23399.1 putative glutathione S-transferase [Nannocystis exedens]